MQGEARGTTLAQDICLPHEVFGLQVGTMTHTGLPPRANSWLNDIVSYIPGKPIEDVARELGLKPEQIIKLASNENPLALLPRR